MAYAVMGDWPVTEGTKGAVANEATAKTQRSASEWKAKLLREARCVVAERFVGEHYSGCQRTTTSRVRVVDVPLRGWTLQSGRLG